MTFHADNPSMPTMKVAMRKRDKALWEVAALLAVNAILLVTQPAFGALPQKLGDYFFGPKLVRAEVVLKDGGAVHDFQVDQGVLRAKTPTSVTLFERDGTMATINVAPTADVSVNGRPVLLSDLKKGALVLTVRDGEAAASIVRAGRR
jgi:hypothetical protein